MKRSDPRPPRGTRYKRRKKLIEFGEFVKSAREAKISSQQKAVEAFAGQGLKISQSWIAQLETGRLTDPDPEILRKIEAAYGIDYHRLVYALIRDKYRLEDRAFASPLTRLRWKAVEALLGSVESVGRVHGLEEHRLRALQKVAGQEILDLEGLAAWQADFPDLQELWIVSSSFQHDKEPSLRAAVLANLKRGVRHLYFVRKTDLEEGKPFWLFLRRLAADVKKSKAHLDQQVRAVPLEEAELRWLAADLILANPTDPETRSGFVGVRHNQATRFAFPLSAWDIERAVNSLLPFVVKKLGKEWLNS